METKLFRGKLAVQQRVLADYRAAFFDILAQACTDGLEVCAGQPRPGESIAITDQVQNANFTAVINHHLFLGRFYLCYQSGLKAWLKACSPDALILEANPRYLSTSGAVQWMKKHRRPVLGWGLGAPNTLKIRKPFGIWVERLLKDRRRAFLHQFDALITYSRRGAKEYASLGFPSERIFVAHNAAAPRPIHPAPSRPSQIRGKPKVLFVGRLQARKRVDLLLKACAALPSELQPDLVIVGDGPERQSLEALSQETFPAARFIGARHGEELVSFFSSADLFALPGTGGLAVQEAMSYGLPVIMGQGDGTNEDLVRPENGWQIPPDDLSALTATLKEALENPSDLRQMGIESYRIVSEEINLEKMAEVFVEALNSVK